MTYEDLYESIGFTVSRLQAERLTLIQYLKAKTEAEDWHAVADAAMDLRDVDNQLMAYENVTSLRKAPDAAGP